MLSGLQCLADYYDRQGWLYDVEEGGEALQCTFSEDNGTYDCVAYADEDNEVLQFYSLMPSRIPSKRLVAVAETLIRINFELKFGAFQMNFDDGEVRFHTNARYLAGEIPEDIIEHIVSMNIALMDLYHPAIMAVAFGEQAPLQAIAEVEANLQPDDQPDDQPDEE